MDKSKISRTLVLFPIGYRAVICAFLAGMAGAWMSVRADSNILVLLLRPLTLLGEVLRAWSLSGAWGNAGAWAAVLVLSAFPPAFMLLIRRKQRGRLHTADWLFPIAGVCIFLCLYLLVNPQLLAGARFAAIHSSIAQIGELIPALVLLCVLTACILVCWADHLHEDRPLKSLLRTMRLLLVCIMALTAASAGYALAQSIQSIPLSAQQIYTPSPLFYEPPASSSASAWGELLLTAISCTSSLFVILTLKRASDLCAAFGEYGFRSETGQCARDLALWAKRSLIVSVLCMAARSIAVMLLSGLLTDLSVAFTLPISDMAVSCGTMLLAHCIAAACRIQHENDMII